MAIGASEAILHVHCDAYQQQPSGIKERNLNQFFFLTFKHIFISNWISSDYNDLQSERIFIYNWTVLRRRGIQKKMDRTGGQMGRNNRLLVFDLRVLKQRSP